MDIWEYLDVEPTRDSKKLVQKVKEFDKVPKSKINWPMYGQTKKDGSYCLVAVNYRGAKLFSRTGKAFNNTDRLAHYVNVAKRYTAIYIAEVCNDYCSLEEMNGLISSERKETLDMDQQILVQCNYLAFHDMISLDAFIKGESPIKHLDRYRHLNTSLNVHSFPDSLRILPLMELKTQEESDTLFDKSQEYGEEGIVLKPDVDWKAGHKGYRMMKRVKGVSYDIEVIGLLYGSRGTKRFGMVSNVILKWKNCETIKADLGKGWTDKDRIDLMRQPSRIVGKIVEVTALQESSKGKLRQPKVGQIRIDKFESDIK